MRDDPDSVVEVFGNRFEREDRVVEVPWRGVTDDRIDARASFIQQGVDGGGDVLGGHTVVGDRESGPEKRIVHGIKNLACLDGRCNGLGICLLTVNEMALIFAIPVWDKLDKKRQLPKRRRLMMA